MNNLESKKRTNERTFQKLLQILLNSYWWFRHSYSESEFRFELVVSLASCQHQKICRSVKDSFWLIQFQKKFRKTLKTILVCNQSCKVHAIFNVQVTRYKYVCNIYFTTIIKQIVFVCECRSFLKYYYVMMQGPKYTS